MNRRSFFSRMAVAPLALAVPAAFLSGPSLHDLPIHSDLSFGSFWWAVEEGKRLGLGSPKELVIGFDNWDFVRLMIGNIPMEHIDANCPIRITVSDKMEPREWHVLFERGRVRSQGPY